MNNSVLCRTLKHQLMSTSEEEDNTIIITFEDLPIASIFGTQLYTKIKDYFNFHLPLAYYDILTEYNETHEKKAIIMQVCTSEGIEDWLLIQERIIPEDVKTFVTKHNLKLANGVKQETIENISRNTIYEETDIWYICYTEKFGMGTPEYWILLQPKHVLLKKDIEELEKNECNRAYPTFESGTVKIHFIHDSLQIKDYQYAEFKIKKFNEKANPKPIKSNIITLSNDINLKNVDFITLTEEH